MNALQASRTRARTGPDPIGSHARETGETAIDADYVARQARMLAAMIDNAQPGDLEYARKMARIFDVVRDALRLHDRMVQSYEDGLTKQAATFAVQAAECGYEIADLHAQLATSFQSLVPFEGKHFSAVHMHDRYPENVPAHVTLEPDPFIDEGQNG